MIYVLRQPVPMASGGPLTKTVRLSGKIGSFTVTFVSMSARRSFSIIKKMKRIKLLQDEKKKRLRMTGSHGEITEEDDLAAHATDLKLIESVGQVGEFLSVFENGKAIRSFPGAKDLLNCPEWQDEIESRGIFSWFFGSKQGARSTEIVRTWTVYKTVITQSPSVHDDTRPGEFRLCNLRVAAAPACVTVDEYEVVMMDDGLQYRSEPVQHMSNSMCNLAVVRDVVWNMTQHNECVLDRMRKAVERCKDINTVGSGIIGTAPVDLSVAELALACSVNQSAQLGNRRARVVLTTSDSMAMNLVSLIKTWLIRILIFTFVLILTATLKMYL
jgi:hypothetical protein